MEKAPNIHLCKTTAAGRVLMETFLIVSTFDLKLAKLQLLVYGFSIWRSLLVGGGSLDSALLLTFYMGYCFSSTFSYHALQQSWRDYHDHGLWAHGLSCTYALFKHK